MEEMAAMRRDNITAVDPKDPAFNIPDIIEDRRKDSEGRTVITKYARGKMLGKGGFAKVFLGTALPQKTQYALKIVAKSSLTKSRAKQKLQTEIKIHRSLKHVNIVKFEKFFEDNINAYILLELCNNNSFSELLKRRKKLSEPETRFYLSQLVSSLSYLHEHLVIHRDLKLGNLFIDSNMKVKVGDFGLATKLTYAEERRKTICGTPNYIAPEILEGKEGHSFEVDIWSTGVIMYTLLVGKPPFESKDVKSTYRRILANSYSFPENHPVGPQAKSLIREMLQSRAEDRISLSNIMKHPFFRETAYMPKYLPASALQECPVFPLPEEPTKPSYTSRYGYDENDPFAGNRLAINGGDEKFAIKKTVDTGRGEPTREALKPRNLNTIASHKAIDDATGTVHNPLMKAGARSSSANPSVKHTATYESSTTPKNTVTSVTRSSSTLSGRTTRSQTPTNTLNVPALSTANERKVSQKFDIFTDDKDTKQKRDKSIELRRESSGSRRLSGEHRDSSRDRSGRRNSIGNEDENPTAVRSLSHIAQRKPSSKRVQDSADEIIDQMQMELENIAINTKEEVKEVAEAWMQQDIYPMDVEQPPLTTNTTDRHLDRFATNQKVGSTDVGEEPDHEAMCISTPRDQIMKEYNKKQLGTLETMHEMLNNSFSILEQQNMPKSVEVEQNANPSSNLVANVWVVRYVDYTSKYGLGFLFNTGSAGVYFNDSTKIVLSPDGTVFQYIERRRKDSSNGSEHSSQTHFISSYPSELQKKVTLLKHFRNYLIDQQKSGTQQADGFDHNDLNCKPGLLQDHASAGATTAVKFGSSSAVTENGEEDLPFLKKWVRTKHAILFRISNKTVQVVFYDRSEVLLSSEVRIITYVSKHGVRSEHSLDNVLQSGRLDIAKRLKYTKDIMYRLINSQPK